jgi:hemolysin III
VAPAQSLPLELKPRFRGVSHQYAFFVSLVLGTLLVAFQDPPRHRVAAAVFAGTVAAMFGVSALYNRVTWSPRARRWMRRLDHTTIFLTVAGTYTPFGLLVLHGAWAAAVLAIVWGGVAIAIGLGVLWPEAPKWLAAAIGIGLGWVGVVALPKLLQGIGVGGTVLLAAGGLLYTAGAIVYAKRRPDPNPTVFGYHEVFHALVVAAVACQYTSVAFFVL